MVQGIKEMIPKGYNSKKFICLYTRKGIIKYAKINKRLALFVKAGRCFRSPTSHILLFSSLEGLIDAQFQPTSMKREYRHLLLDRL